MDKLVETKRERFWNPEAWARDTWVRQQALSLPKGSRVLDAGAGASKYQPFFTHCQYETQDFCQYTGQLVKYLRPIDHVSEITAIPLPDASLDAILCTEVLEHVVDPMAVLAEFSRLLKPGGKLLLTVPHGAGLHMEPYHYYTGYTHYWYRHWLPKKGFRLDEIEPQCGPGRAAVSALHNFYGAWRVWEQKLSQPRRLASAGGRMLLKIPFHYLLPFFVARLDPHLDRMGHCSGFMVAATRVTG